jgi:hypothetical protein
LGARLFIWDEQTGLSYTTALSSWRKLRENMTDSDTLARGELKVIVSFREHLDDVFAISTGTKAPTILAEKKRKHARGLTKRYLMEFEALSNEEKEEFLDALLDAVSGSLTTDEARKILKRIGTIGKVGELLDRIEKQLHKMDDNQRLQFTEEALQISLEKIGNLRSLLGREILDSGKDRFEYLLVSQSIVRDAENIVRSALRKLKKDRRLRDEQTSLLGMAIYGLLRIEAFRRGKMGISDLFDTNTMFLLHVPSQELACAIEPPDWAVA